MHIVEGESLPTMAVAFTVAMQGHTEMAHHCNENYVDIEQRR